MINLCRSLCFFALYSIISLSFPSRAYPLIAPDDGHTANNRSVRRWEALKDEKERRKRGRGEISRFLLVQFLVRFLFRTIGGSWCLARCDADSSKSSSIAPPAWWRRSFWTLASTPCGISLITSCTVRWVHGCVCLYVCTHLRPRSIVAEIIFSARKRTCVLSAGASFLRRVILRVIKPPFAAISIDHCSHRSSRLVSFYFEFFLGVGEFFLNSDHYRRALKSACYAKMIQLAWSTCFGENEDNNFMGDFKSIEIVLKFFAIIQEIKQFSSLEEYSLTSL